MVNIARDTVLLYIATFFSYLGIAVFVPLLSLYIKYLGGTGSEIGFIFSLFFGTMIVFGAIFGAIIDLYGHEKKLLLLGTLLTILSFYGIGTSHAVEQVAFYRAMMGIGFAGFNTSATVTVTRFSSKYGKEVGDYTVFQALGLLVGYFLGGLFAESFGMDVAFQIIAIIASPSIIAVAFLRPPSKERGQESVSEKVFLKSVKKRLLPSSSHLLSIGIILAYIAYFVRTMAMSGWKAFVSIYLNSLGASLLLLGIIYAVSVIPQLPITPLVGRLIDKFGAKKFIVLSLITTAFYIGITPLIDNYWYGLVLISLDGVIFGIMFTAVSGYVSKYVPEENRGEAIGLIYTSFGFGGLLGPILSGILVDLFGMVAMMYFFSLLTIPIAILALKYLY